MTNSSYAQSNNITGTVFLDVDSDTIYDGTDVRQPAVGVILAVDNNGDGSFNSGDSIIGTDITDAYGEFNFAVGAGDYVLIIDTGDLAPGNTFSTDNLEVASFTANDGSVDSANDIGFEGLSVSSFAFARNGQALYVYNSYSGTNDTIGISTGSASANVQAMSLSLDNSTLFAVNNVPFDDHLGTIDMRTGQFTPKPNDIGTVTGASGTFEADSVFGIDFDPADGTLYGIVTKRNNNLLIQIDTASGMAVANAFGVGQDYVQIQQAGMDRGIDDMAFDPQSGDLYALEQDLATGQNGTFVIIDKQAGTITTVGNTNIDNIEGLTFNGAGLFLGTTGQQGQFPNSIVQISKSTGNATFVDNFKFGFMDFESTASFGQPAQKPQDPQDPLPVKLLSFEVDVVNEDALVTWKTGWERNSSHFVLERGVDGKHFKALQRISAKGHSSIISTYTAVDSEVANDVQYYRLRQVDLDGSEEFSRVIVLDMDARDTELSMYPVPALAGEYITLIGSDSESDNLIRLVDLTGRTVFETRVERSNGNYSVKLPNGLHSGVYLITVGQRSGRVIIK